MQLLTEVEQLRVEPDQPAKVVIDEQSGIIVMGQRCAGIRGCHRAGQPHRHDHRDAPGRDAGPLHQCSPRSVVRRTGISVNDSAGNRLATIHEGVTLRELVDGLNALGVGPRDLISILQAIKAAGALQAEIEVM